MFGPIFSTSINIKHFYPYDAALAISITSLVYALRPIREPPAGRSLLEKEHLLVSKVLPIFLAPYYFCAYSDLSLLYEAYSSSSQAEF